MFQKLPTVPFPLGSRLGFGADNRPPAPDVTVTFWTPESLFFRWKLRGGLVDGNKRLGWLPSPSASSTASTCTCMTSTPPRPSSSRGATGEADVDAAGKVLAAHLNPIPPRLTPEQRNVA